jgi:hypothetical protein
MEKAEAFMKERVLQGHVINLFNDIDREAFSKSNKKI